MANVRPSRSEPSKGVDTSSRDRKSRSCQRTHPRVEDAIRPEVHGSTRKINRGLGWRPPVDIPVELPTLPRPRCTRPVLDRITRIQQPLCAHHGNILALCGSPTPDSPCGYRTVSAARMRLHICWPPTYEPHCCGKRRHNNGPATLPPSAPLLR